jgi:hypothetical protein
VKHRLFLDVPSSDLVCSECGHRLFIHRYLSAQNAEERLALSEGCLGQFQEKASNQ